MTNKLSVEQPVICSLRRVRKYTLHFIDPFFWIGFWDQACFVRECNSGLYFFRLIRGAGATRVCSCTMSRMTKNDQKIYSRNPVLLSDLLGNVGTTKSQCFSACFAWGPSRTGGRSKGKREIKDISLLIFWRPPRPPEVSKDVQLSTNQIKFCQIFST